MSSRAADQPESGAVPTASIPANDIRTRKRIARARWRKVRSSISFEARTKADTAILENLQSLPEFQAARTVLSYLSFGDEVDTRSAIELAWASNKEVALPRTVRRQHRLRFYRIDNFDGLVPASFGGLEPKCEKDLRVHARSVEDAICIVPGIVYDRRGFRLGYGGGYYDRFIDRFAGTTIGVCREATLSKRNLPTDEFDRRVDILVTDAQVVRLD